MDDTFRMRLFIAEKPSLARAIANALTGAQRKRSGYIECGDVDVVTWCAGHILELASPEQYGAQYKTWTVEHLPIAPETWKLSVTAPDLVKTIATLLPRATEVVHAGDPDREGQLLVDEVLEYLGYRGRVVRLLVSDLNTSAVRKALGQMQPNANYRGLFDSARARQRADWLFGLNLTRLYTILGREGGYDGVLSVGRVQTPLLGLVVQRDRDIERFTPKPFFTLTAPIRSSGGPFTATWRAPEGHHAYLDEGRRLISKGHADTVVAHCSGQRGRVVASARERKTEAPPPPYSLSVLQVDAGKRLGLSPQDTLDACQALYETHRLTTYPRSDCSYLPEGHFSQAAAIFEAIAQNAIGLSAIVATANPTIRSTAWSDAKITAHHAIIPTPEARVGVLLTEPERLVYDLIARRYLAQFHPPFEFDQTQIDIEAGGEHWRAQGKRPVVDGWRRVLRPSAEHIDKSEDAVSTDELPLLRDGEEVQFARVVATETKTTPPKRFSDATLLEAMSGISRFVSDPKIRLMLRETDGIGTPATQAATIQTLHERHYIEKQGRQIVSTPMGRALIDVLPIVATTPDMTALWEAAMRQIANGQMPLSTFLEGVLRQLRELISQGQSKGPLAVPGARACTAEGCRGFLRKRSGGRGAFWSCTRYPACRNTIPDADLPRSPGPPNKRSGRRPRTSRQ